MTEPTEHPLHRVLFRREYLCWFFSYKAFVIAAAWLSLGLYAGIWPVSPTHFIHLFFEWDAKHILRVASEGYLSQPPTAQVFPLTPLSIRLFFGLIPEWHWAAFVSTQVWSYFAFYFFYELSKLRLPEASAKRALVLFAFFPTAYFLTAPYSEAPFCALVFGAVYLLEKDSKLAPLFAFGAGLARMTGFFLAPSAFFLWLAEGRKRTRALGLFASACVMGYVVYLVMNATIFGDAFFYVADQNKHWGVHIGVPFKSAYWKILSWPGSSLENKISVVAAELAATFAAIALLPALYRQRRVFDFLWVSTQMALLVSLSFWISRPRYLLPLYPLYWVGAQFFDQRPRAFFAYLTVSTVLFLVYWALYLNAKWAF